MAKAKVRRTRDKQVTLRVSDAEFKAFRERADELGENLNAWIRKLCRRDAGLPTL
jgi:hypothetical protein